MKCLIPILLASISIATDCLAATASKYDGYVINLGKVLQTRTDMINGTEVFSYSTVTTRFPTFTTNVKS